MIKTFIIVPGFDQFRGTDCPFPFRVGDTLHSDVITSCNYYASSEVCDLVEGRTLRVSQVRYGLDESGYYYQVVSIEVQ